MKTKNTTSIDKKFINQVYLHVVENLKLKHRDARVFFRLLGLLLMHNKPISYTAEALGKHEQYSARTVFRAFNHLETLRLIERVGESFNRKFFKGAKLIEICILLKNSSTLEQTQNNTPMPNCQNNALIKNDTDLPSCHGSVTLSHGSMPKGHILEQEELNKTTTVVVDENIQKTKHRALPVKARN